VVRLLGKEDPIGCVSKDPTKTGEEGGSDEIESLGMRGGSIGRDVTTVEGPSAA